jgi:capsular polysaccharide biosynthesis protein
MTSTIEFNSIFHVAQKRKWHLLVIALLGAVCGFVFSGESFIRPKYKSQAIVYPVNIIPYSSESPSEQLLQLLRSSDVRSMMIRRFRLAQHYSIDTAVKAGKMKLFNAYEENISIRQTEYQSVKIDVYDTDPDSASSMANALIRFANLKASQLQHEKAAEVVEIYRAQLAQKQMQIDSLEKKMTVLRNRYGLLDYKAQSKELTRGALKSGTNRANGADSLMRHLRERGGELLSVGDQLDQLRKDNGNIRTQYDKALSDLNKKLTYSNIIASPYPADAKSYPMRSLITLICGCSLVFLAFILFLLFDSRKKSFITNNGNAKDNS